ncbi:MAG TPA: RNA polymerase subunit sigma-70 [Acidimicrobiales bacterium]|nr:RNA polymerase subunit sigma-70 [Acidimicrobiales bacterium]
MDGRAIRPGQITDGCPAGPAGERAFATLVDRHRRELHVHCYRMLGSYTDAEDLVQETFLRAWRGRDGFAGRSSFRTWLYRIATNACLDALEHGSRRVQPVAPGGDPLADLPGLQPYPDHLLDTVAPPSDDPDAVVVSRETVELTFLAAIQHLPPRQRAVLIMRDVLGWTAAEAASLLDVSEATANSLVQRARATLRRHRPGGRHEWSPARASEEERAVLRRYVDAHARADADAIVAMLRSDSRVTMPPEAPCVGRDAAAAFFRALLGAGGPGDWSLVPTRANRRPATANYLRRHGGTAYRALSIDVLHVEDGRLAAVNCFLGDDLFPAFGLPPVLRPGR